MNPLSGVLGEAWRTYRAHAAHLIAIAAGIYLVAAVLEGLLYLVNHVVGLVLGLLIGLVAAFLVQAALVKAAQDVRDGRADLSIGQTVSAASQVIWPVIGASILAVIAIAVGLVLLIVPGLFLITIWAVIVPAIVIERSGVFASFGRSQRLVRGNGWNVFGILVLTVLILIGFQLVLGLVLSALPMGLARGISTLVAGALVAPFEALVVTTIYFRLIGVESGTAPAQPQWPGGEPAWPQQPGSPGGEPPYPPPPGSPGGQPYPPPASPGGEPPYPPPPGSPGGQPYPPPGGPAT